MTYFQFSRIYKAVRFFIGVFIVGMFLWSSSAVKEYQTFGYDLSESMNKVLLDAAKKSFVVSLIFTGFYILITGEKKKVNSISAINETTNDTALSNKLVHATSSQYQDNSPLKFEVENIKNNSSLKITKQRASIITKYAREHSISTSSNEDDKLLTQSLIDGSIKLDIIEKFFNTYKTNKQESDDFENYLIPLLVNNNQIQSLESLEQLPPLPVEPATKIEEPLSEVPAPEIEPAGMQEKINNSETNNRNKQLLLFMTYSSILFILSCKIALAVDKSQNYFRRETLVVNEPSAFNLYYSWWVWIAYIIIVAVGANFIFDLKITLKDLKNKRK